MDAPRSPFVRDLIWRAEALGFDLFAGLARLAPIDGLSAAGGALFRWLGPLTSAHRTARRSLRLAFPDMQETERAAILAAQWENFGRYIFEFPVLDRLTVASGRVEVRGAERLAAIAAGGRPTVFISGHFANLEVMPVVILEAGIACEITYRAVNNPHVDRRIRASRRRYGVSLFAPKGEEGARHLLAALKAGRSVAMMNDQRYDGGTPGLFFGREVRTLPAAVRLAQRFGATLQPLSLRRTRGARFVCTVHAPIALPSTGDRAADLASGVQAVNAFIEARVRESPGEWWWLHRRWPREDYARLAEAGA